MKRTINHDYLSFGNPTTIKRTGAGSWHDDTNLIIFINRIENFTPTVARETSISK